MKAREYAGPLGVLAAGAIGISLLCSVSAMAMGDLNNRISITMEPLNIVDLAYANIETAAALTEQVVTAFVPTQTLAPTNTLSPTPLPSDTSTPRRFVTITPTGTRRGRSTFTPTRIPTQIPPTRTSIPPPTITSTPLPTATDVPTNTPMPTATDVPTNTPPPPPDTNTPPPPPDTDTPAPPPDTDTPVPDTPAGPGPFFEATGTTP